MPADPQGGAVRLRVRASPKASRNEIAGIVEDSEGRRALRIRVTAPADKGRANKAILKLLARTLGLAPSCLSVITGGHNRTKTILIDGDPADILARLRPYLKRPE